jgi:arylsulfatase A-like enzyme
VDDRLLEAIDVAPTLLSLAGAAVPAKMQGRPFLGAAAGAPKTYVFGARDRCDMTAMRIRSVRDVRYRYIRTFTPEVPFFAFNAYKEKQYPAWTLLPQLFAQGKLTPPQAFLCQPRQPEEQLYDLDADPHEIQNLAGSTKPEHFAALKRLRGELEDWIVRTDDKGRFPEVMSASDADAASRTVRPKGAAKKKKV